MALSSPAKGYLSEPAEGARRSLPHGHELADFLRAITPLGSPAVRCWIPGPYDEEVVLPLTGRAFSGFEFTSLTEPWIVQRLEQLLPGQTLEMVEGRADLATMLAPGLPGPRGLPAYLPADPLVAGALARILSVTLREGRVLRVPRRAVGGMRVSSPLSNPSGSGRGRNGARYEARGLLAAVSVDLLGHPFETIAQELLNLHDDGGGTNTNAHRCLRRGRALLCGLGVWPWTHAENTGRLPTNWVSQAIYTAPFWSWSLRCASEADRAAAERRAAVKALAGDAGPA